MEATKKETPTHFGIIFLIILMGAIILGPQVIEGQRIIGSIGLLWPLALILSKRKMEAGKEVKKIDEYLPKK